MFAGMAVLYGRRRVAAARQGAEIVHWWACRLESRLLGLREGLRSAGTRCRSVTYE